MTFYKKFVDRYSNYNTKSLAIAVFVAVLVLLFSTVFMFTMITNGVDAVYRERNYRTNMVDFMERTEELSNYAYNYIGTGDIVYYNDYVKLVQDESREKSLNNVLLIENLSEHEIEVLNNLLIYSDKITEYDMQAFEMFAQGDVSDARDLLFFSEDYTNLTAKIIEGYEELSDGIDDRINFETNKIMSSTVLSIIITTIVAFSTVFTTTLLLMKFKRVREESELDQLTGLQNRNSYKEKIAELINEKPDKYGAMIFSDIDNLKFINDCYGHDNGDNYIRAMANALSVFKEYENVSSRPSGDEFVVYIHGFDTKEELVNAISEKIDIARNSYFTTTLHIEEKIRFSTGIAIYPDDSLEVGELLKFSDYAMFNMKKSSKGEVAYYDKVTIDKGFFLVRNRGYLDEFLEKELLDFALQVIVDANTFEIYGYEALMRPQINVINSPFLLLALAKEESKLDKIERLVFKKVFEKISKLKELEKYKIFINSIADQELSQKEIQDYRNKYPDIFKRLVIEVTEQEYAEESLLEGKTRLFKDYGANIALDDYGSGYSNEFSILTGLYDIIKIDMKIIRDIDTDLKRQEIVKTVIRVSKLNNFRVLAEGVETANEVLTLQELGVDYMQGYFFGKPDLELKEVNASAFELLKK
ncbi:MAG: EAL domain-containing protein [Lachnospirales bacterium]